MVAGRIGAVPLTPEDLAQQALATCRPGISYGLEGLGGRSGGHVFRARPKAGGRWLIVKIGEADQMAVQARRLRQVWRNLRDHPHARVPQPLHHAPGVLVMEDALAEPMATVWADGIPWDKQARQLARAGEWITAFHALTAQVVPCDPAPHLRWLERQGAQAPDLIKLADQAAGRPAGQAVTHRDLHLGNLILRGNGLTYGLDFENARPDVALRDPLMLLVDAALRGGIGVENLPDAARTLGLPPQPDPAPALFFQRFFAHAQLARLQDSGSLHRRALCLWLRDHPEPLF